MLGGIPSAGAAVNVTMWWVFWFRLLHLLQVILLLFDLLVPASALFPLLRVVPLFFRFLSCVPFYLIVISFVAVVVAVCLLCHWFGSLLSFVVFPGLIMEVG